MWKKVHEIDSTAIDALVSAFGGEGNLIRAAFKHSYFINPEAVRKESPLFPGHARRSREHYPGKEKGDTDIWRAGDSRKVTLDLNHYAQSAWERYSGHRIQRRTGYGVRHIWGHPWNPDAFTAGWNLCYMPFWAGMLTEKQHPLPKLEEAFRQASWNLYFAENPVCPAPDFVKDPGIDLDEILQGQPILILSPTQSTQTPTQAQFDSLEEYALNVRAQRNQSWSNLYKAVRAMQGKTHEPFGTKNVENTSKSAVRKILKSAGRDCSQENLAELESIIAQRLQDKNE